MAEMKLQIDTDANGYFQKTETLNPPGPFNLTVALFATLESPPDTTIDARLDIDARDGNPSNQAKDFRASTGQRVSLGAWRLDGGDNIVVTSGKTTPARPKTTLIVKLEAEL